MRALIVEDNTEIREDLTRILKKAGFVVDAAADCAEARAMSVSAELHASVATDTAGVLKFKAFAHCGISITLK